MSMASAQRFSILVVEDDPGDLGLIRSIIRRAGLLRIGEPEALVVASTLGAGISAALEQAPDVVLLDLSLPDSSGTATVVTMRSTLPETPIIVLTGHDDEQVADAALLAGAQDYLVKGQFEHDALRRAVRHALARQKLESRQRLLEAALNSAANGILITDVAATIVWANPAFTRMTGWSLEDALGRAAGELLNSGTQDTGFYQRMWETILAGEVWSGEVVNRRKDGSLYDEILTISPVIAGNGTIQHFVAIKQDISERKATEERVQHLAHYDQLTDLPNRALLADRLAQTLAQARRDRGTLALMFLDLDRFKPVNDTLGHDVGDLLLKQVARRLLACVARETDTVSRFGGDEFVILLAPIDKPADAVAMAGKVLAAISRPFVVGPHTVNISASIGIAVYPQHGDDVARLLKSADTAMYYAKNAGRNRYRFFRELSEAA